MTTAAAWEDPITFFVHGIATPQGSARAFVNKRTNRAIVTSDNKGLKGWRQTIADVAQEHAHMLDGAVGVRLTFVMPRTKSLPKSRWKPMVTRPDIDKLARAALDALTGIFYTDDARVTDLHVYKRYASIGGPVGVEVTVWEPVAEDAEVSA